MTFLGTNISQSSNIGGLGSSSLLDSGIPFPTLSTLANYIAPNAPKTYQSGTKIDEVIASGSEGDTFAGTWDGAALTRSPDWIQSEFDGLGGFVTDDNNERLVAATPFTSDGTFQFGMVFETVSGFGSTDRPHILSLGTGTSTNQVDAEMIILESSGGILRWYRNESQGSDTIETGVTGNRYFIYINARSNTEWDFYLNGQFKLTVDPDNSYAAYTRLFFGGGSMKFTEPFVCSSAHSPSNDSSIEDISNYFISKYSIT